MNTQPKTAKPPSAIESERLCINRLPRQADQHDGYQVQEKLSGQVVLVISRAPGSAFVCQHRITPHTRQCVLNESWMLLKRQAQNGENFVPLAQEQADNLCQSLGIADSSRDGLPFFPEACRLQTGGLDCFGRPFQLHPLALAAWRSMQSAAAAEGISLAVVSGFRSYAYQAHLIRKKTQTGQDMQAILQVNATPGHSEHHTGLAVDLHCPEEAGAPPPLSEAFENTRAFAWLTQYAQQYGFRLSYPRNNRHGFIYEPWHWCLMPEAITDTTPYTSSA